MKNFFKNCLLLGFLVIILGCRSSSLDISNPWARPASEGGNTGVYFMVSAQNGFDDKLLSASTPIAETVEIHRSFLVDIESGSDESKEHQPSTDMDLPDGKVMKMQKQEYVDIAKGEMVEFKPGGLHVMLINLKTDLTPGREFDLSLHFEIAGEIAIHVPVKTP